MIDPSSTPPPSIEKLQEIFPQLEILSFIGHGGMGTFYKARQPKMDRLTAIKVFLVDPVTDQELIQSFKHEVSIIAKLSHPNITRVYDFGETAEALYMILEHIEGDILERLLTSRGFDLKEVFAIIMQVCDALKYAHEQGAVHRDIRPGNTMLNYEGKVKLSNFGLARLIGDELFRHNLTESNQEMGTMDYVAPEQLEPDVVVDHRADIYSLGMMFYKLVTHTLPYGTFKLPSEVVPNLPKEVDEIIVRSLQKDPAYRYQSIRKFRADLAECFQSL